MSKTLQTNLGHIGETLPPKEDEIGQNFFFFLKFYFANVNCFGHVVYVILKPQERHEIGGGEGRVDGKLQEERNRLNWRYRGRAEVQALAYRI